MSTLEEIKDNLRSDKVTVRKKAKTECESRLLGDRAALAGNNALTMGFLVSALEYVVTEINLAASKGKPVDLDVSTFFRNVVKFCINFGLVKSHAAAFLFKDSIDILCNEDLPAQFIANHKNALAYMLQPNVVHGLPFDHSLKMVIIYLKEFMVETAGLKDPIHHKILKAVSLCSFRDDSGQPSFLANVVGWLVKQLQVSSEDQQVHALITATTAECCAHFLQYQNINVYSFIAKDLETIFQAVVKYLSAFQFREQHKDSYVLFIDTFLDVARWYHAKTHTNMLDRTVLCDTLQQLCEYLFSDTHLRSIVTALRPQSATAAAGRDPMVVQLPEILGESGNKLMPLLTVMSKVAICCDLVDCSVRQDQEASAGTVLGGRKLGRGADDSMNERPAKRMRGELSGPGSSSNFDASAARSAAGQSSGGSSTCGGKALARWNLFHRLAGLSLDPAASATQSRNVPVSGGSATGAKATVSHVLESTLVVLLLVLRSPDGTRALDADAVIQWVRLMRDKVEDILQHSSSDAQLLGTALLVMKELALLSSKMIENMCLQGAWSSTCEILLNSNKMASFLPASGGAVRKDTVYACLLDLLSSILNASVLDPRVLQSLREPLWRWSFVQNPASIECPVAFHYLASSLSAFDESVPRSVYLAICGVAVDAGYAELATALPVPTGGRHSPLTLPIRSDSTGTSSGSGSSVESIAGVGTVAVWLMTQLSPPSQAGTAAAGATGSSMAASASSITRIPVVMLRDYVTSLHAVIAADVCPDCAPSATCPDTKLVPLHWLQGLPPLPSATRHHRSQSPVSSSAPQLDVHAFLRVLDTVKQTLVAAVTAHAVKSEASDQFTAWQTVTLLTMSAYASIAHVAHQQTCATPAVEGASEHGGAALASCLVLGKALVVYTERKLSALKLIHLAEFYEALGIVLLRIQPALIAVSTSAVVGEIAVETVQQLARLRIACVNAIEKSVRTFHSITTNKASHVANGAGRHKAEVEDEFMEHTAQSTINRANLEEGSDDDDVSASVYTKRRNMLLFTHEQLLVFCALAKCAVALQETVSSTAVGLAADAGTSAEKTIAKVIDGLFTTEVSGQVVKLSTDSETKLLLAQAVVPFSPSGAAPLNLLSRTSWQLDWGALAYTKVLAIVLQLLQNSAFWVGIDTVVDPYAESTLGQVVNYVFPEEGEQLEKFLPVQWQCRYLQVLCIGELMQRADVTAVKSNISAIFLAAFSDTNCNVRLAAAHWLPSLLKLFKNTRKVYQSLVDGSGVLLLCDLPASSDSGSSSSDGAVDRPMDVVALAEGISRMGSANCAKAADAGLAAVALLDLCKLCCSRHKLGLLSTEVRFPQLLRCCVSAMAQERGYCSTEPLMLEHLRWLLHEWLLLGAGDKETSGPSASQLGSLSQSSGRSGLSLADFPCELLASTDVLGPVDREQQVRSFLRMHSAIVVPVICQLENSRYRWSCMLQYATAAGYSSTDRDVAVIVKRNVCALKALELTLSCAADLRDRYGLDYDLDVELGCKFTTVAGRARHIAQSVQDFVTRSSSAAELSVYLTSKVTDVVSEAVQLQCYGELGDWESTGEDTLESISDVLTGVFLQIGHLVGTASLPELFAQCNLLDILSTLHIRLLESRHTGVHTAVLAFVHVLLANLPIPPPRALLQAILQVLHTAVAQRPEQIAECVEVLGRLVTYTVERGVKAADVASPALSGSPAGRAVAAGDGHAYTAASVTAFVPELFAECLLVLKHLAMQLATSPSPTANASLQVLVNSTKLDRHSAETDHFVVGYYQPFQFVGSRTRTSLAKDVEPRSLQEAVTSLHSAVVRILHHCAKTFNTSLLVPVIPLPRGLLRDCLRRECASFEAGAAALSLADRMRLLVSAIQRRIGGEMVSMGYIWLQLQIVTSMVASEGGENEQVCTWAQDVDLLSEFLSALVALCRHLAERRVVVAPHGTPAPLAGSGVSSTENALHQAVLRLLGHFGSPDLLSLNHTKFPAQIQRTDKVGAFKADAIKQQLLLRTYALIWAEPAQAKVAAAVLRDLSCAGYPTTVLSAALLLDTVDGMVAEVAAVYAHSVIARERTMSATTPAKSPSRQLWSAELWDTARFSTYGVWLCQLCCHLLEDCFDDAANGAATTTTAPIAVTKSVDKVLTALKPVLAIRADIAEAAFPLIVAAIQTANSTAQAVVAALSDCISMYLLSPHCRFKEATQLGCKLLTFLLRQEVSEFSRSRPASSTSPRAAVNAHWNLPFSCGLQVDYAVVAQAATRCQLVCTALLFAELGDEIPRHAADDQRTSLECTVAPNRAAISASGLPALLLPIYEGIHDADAMYGLDLCSTLELQALMYTRKGKWMEALATYEGMLESQAPDHGGRRAAESGIAAALVGLGAQHTFEAYTKATNGSRNAGTVLQTWNLPDSPHSSGAVPGLRGMNLQQWGGASFLSSAVGGIGSAGYIVRASTTTVQATEVLSGIMTRMTEETAMNILPGLTMAQRLTEIREVGDLLLPGIAGREQRHDPSVLVKRWQARVNSQNSAAGESQFGLRAALLRRLLDAGKLSAFEAVQCVCRGDLAVKSSTSAHAITPLAYKFWGEVAGRLQAGAVLTTMQQREHTLLQAQMAYYECRLLWTKGLKDAAVSSVNARVISTLKALVQEAGPTLRSGAIAVADYNAHQELDARSRNLLSEALCACGEWMTKKRAATGTEILDEYLDPAVQLATGPNEVIRAYTTLATFHARLHQNLKEKIQSAEWAQGARVLADRRKEYDDCRQLQEKLRREAQRLGSDAHADGVDLKSLYRHVATLKKEIEMDSKEREAVEQSVQRYLVAAVTDYVKVLELSKEADVESVFRLVQLWLSNCDSPQVNALMEDAIAAVPSYKFVPLSYQILSRLGGTDGTASTSSGSQKTLAERLRATPTPMSGARPTAGSGLNRTTTACSTISGLDLTAEEGENGFQLALCRMVIKLATEHPHHILPQLFALAHEREFSHDEATHVKQNLSASRLETANMLVTQLKANAAARDLVGSTQAMLLAYIDLANASTLALQKVGRTKDIKFKEVQARGKRFDEVMRALPLSPAVITLSLPLNPANDYRDAVVVHSIQPTFSITDNGISRPKIVGCIGSDGRRYVQLVKGGDDMRQDAVMQQVFANVNFTLARDEETQKRNLAIRTYKIIPTTPQTGILEWVQNTAAFGSLLCDRDSGVHAKYYPNDWSHSQCREHLKDATDNADKLRRYQDICRSFHPAFRFFLLERFPEPVAWVAARLAYSRSVAANSIIGYILGIGDRHAHNILIDTVTAEVVHIDFGIVFEQGKGLGTPETVPFRLTRDVVDGMGVTATEGTFRRSCEEVLRVLRDNAPQIMTILEVVIHDPLYKWSLSPLQARMKQNTLPDYNADLAAVKAGRAGGNGHANVVPYTSAAATGVTKGGGNFGKDAAERTLQRVLNKLHGQEDPSSGEALSIEGQVDMLINEARSPHNLSKLFPGWAPWL